MIKTLEQIKKEKNYLACRKGYPIDPEGFTIIFLFERLEKEYKELKEARNNYFEGITAKNDYYEAVIDELADMSNFIDYIANKIITNYPNKYIPEEVKG